MGSEFPGRLEEGLEWEVFEEMYQGAWGAYHKDLKDINGPNTGVWEDNGVFLEETDREPDGEDIEEKQVHRLVRDDKDDIIYEVGLTEDTIWFSLEEGHHGAYSRFLACVADEHGLDMEHVDGDFYRISL